MHLWKKSLLVEKQEKSFFVVYIITSSHKCRNWRWEKKTPLGCPFLRHFSHYKSICKKIKSTYNHGMRPLLWQQGGTLSLLLLLLYKSKYCKRFKLRSRQLNTFINSWHQSAVYMRSWPTGSSFFSKTKGLASQNIDE